jgi:hypothetical protein
MAKQIENWVLRKMLKTEEITGGWRKLHRKGLQDLHSSSNVVRVAKPRRMKWAGSVACTEMRRRIPVSGRKREKKEPHGRSRRRLEDTIKKINRLGALYRRS